MMSPIKRKYQRQPRRSPVILLLLILLWSLVFGWGLAAVSNTQPTAQGSNSEAIATVDVVPAQYQLGQELYLQNCAKCHIALPPAVLPTQTWQQILQDQQHYGVNLPLLIDPPRLLIWNYLQTFSRAKGKEEETIYRVDNSRFFKALHPKVKLSRPIEISSCVSCHPSAEQFNFRTLTTEWETSP